MSHERSSPVFDKLCVGSAEEILWMNLLKTHSMDLRNHEWLSHRYSYQAMDITTSNEVYFWSGIHITAGFDKQFHYLIVSTASSNTECKLWKQNCSDKNNHVKDWSQMTIRRYTIIICGIFWNFKSLFLSLIIPKYQLLLIPILWNTNSWELFCKNNHWSNHNVVFP